MEAFLFNFFLLHFLLHFDILIVFVLGSLRIRQAL